VVRTGAASASRETPSKEGQAGLAEEIKVARRENAYTRKILWLGPHEEQRFHDRDLGGREFGGGLFLSKGVRLPRCPTPDELSPARTEPGNAAAPALSTRCKLATGEWSG